MRARVYWVVRALLFVAFVSSFFGGADGAALLGYVGIWAYVPPLILDVVAATATEMHRDPRLRRLATVYVLVPMGLSWAAQAIAHVKAVASGAALTWQAMVAVFAGVAPVAVAALLYFAQRIDAYEGNQSLTATGSHSNVVYSSPGSANPGEVKEAGGTAATPPRGTDPRSRLSLVPTPDVLEWARASWPVTITQVRDKGLSRRQATALCQQIKAEREAVA